MSDIRKFFSSSGASSASAGGKKSSLTAERKTTCTPKAEKNKKEDAKPSQSRRKASMADLDASSDSESPMPKSLQREVRKRESLQIKRRKLVDSSDDDSDVVVAPSPPSKPKHRSARVELHSSDSEVLASPKSPKKKQPKPPATTSKPISPKKGRFNVTAASAKSPKKNKGAASPKPAQKRKRPVISSPSGDSDVEIASSKAPGKRQTRAAPAKRSKARIEDSDDSDFVVDDDEIVLKDTDSSDAQQPSEEEEVLPQPKKSSRRRRLPSDQGVLDAVVVKKPIGGKLSPAKSSKAPAKDEKYKKVDPMLFFNSAIDPAIQQKKTNPSPVKKAKIPDDDVVFVDSSDEEPAKKPQSRSPVKAPAAKVKSSPVKAAVPKVASPAKKSPPTRKPLAESNKKSPKSAKTVAPVKPDLPVLKKPKSTSKVVDPPVFSSVKTSTTRSTPPPKALPALPRPVKPELPWVDKYKPTSIKQLVGQGTDKSSANKLLGWLRLWAKNNLGPGGLVKKPKPSPMVAQSDGTAFKAALLSGPPGIGKTTTAELVCQELGLKFVAMNASDARNKKLLENKVSGILDNRQIDEYLKGEKPTSKNNVVTHVLIMDEVDGMSGNQDRAGIAEVIQMIKDTKIPIICICNDRQSTKIRSLANHCFDLRFTRPRAEQIKSRLATIIAREKVRVSPQAMTDIIEASNHDVRQCIYSLQLTASNGKGKVEKKDVSLNIFEAARQLMSQETNLSKKQEMFFVDYAIMPLFVQENYPHIRQPKISERKHISMLRQAADCLADADLFDKQIRSQGAWSLLPDFGMMSAALPTAYLDGFMTDQINFPGWLGKNSNQNKRLRILRQVASHGHLSMTGPTSAVSTDYIPLLRQRMTKPLIKKESEGIRDALAVYNHYYLTKDDAEGIAELGTWPGKQDVFQLVNTKTKSAFTRALNKDVRLLPYASGAVAKGKKKAAAALVDELDEEGHVITAKIGGGDDDDDDQDEADEETPDVKIKVTTAAKTKAPAGRGGRGGRGRGRGR